MRKRIATNLESNVVLYKEEIQALLEEMSSYLIKPKSEKESFDHLNLHHKIMDLRGLLARDYMYVSPVENPEEWTTPTPIQAGDKYPLAKENLEAVIGRKIQIETKHQDIKLEGELKHYEGREYFVEGYHIEDEGSTWLLHYGESVFSLKDSFEVL